MLLNETEAKEKWCPMTLQGRSSKCLASACMAWRWSEYTPHVCVNCGIEETVWLDQPETRRGFCGLPGPPKF